MPVRLLPGRAARPLVLSLSLLAGGVTLAQAPTGKPAEPAPMPRAGGQPSAAVELDHRIMAEIKANAQIMPNLAYLSDAIGPRLTGSANLERANKWTAEKMREYGLENVHLEAWEIPVGWERGTASMRLLDGGAGRPLLIASAGWSPGTKGKVTGQVMVLDIRTKADFAKYKGKLKNAIVLRGAPPQLPPVAEMLARQGLGGGPEGKKDFPRRGAKDDAKKDEPKKEEPKKDAPPGDQQQRPNFEEMRAFRQELSEFLRVEGVACMVSDSNKPHGLLVTTGGWREGDRGTQQEPVPSVYMAHEHYALLHRLATAKDAKPVQVELEIDNKFIPGPITVYNTVGDVVGSEKPDEVVVVGAHLDSWDLASGTTDNGTGSCVVLETARAISKLAGQGYRPKRTIRFILFTGEEQGLWGSRRYAEKHKAELDKFSAVLVHDTGTGKVRGFGLLGREQVKKILDAELTTLKEVDGWTGLTLGGITGGTDHWSFDRAGVPGFAASQESYEYPLTHHTQSDTFDKAVPANLVQGATVVAVTAVRIANLPALLPREKVDRGGFGGRGGFRPKEKDDKKPDEKKPDEKKGA